MVAGPGSGKTRVLTARAAHLVLRRGVAPWEIMTLTFTNKVRQRRVLAFCTLPVARFGWSLSTASTGSRPSTWLRMMFVNGPLPPQAGDEIRERLSRVLGEAAARSITAGASAGAPAFCSRCCVRFLFDFGDMHVPDGSVICAGTFHSISARILRQHINLLPGCGRSDEHVIYDAADSLALLRRYVRDVAFGAVRDANVHHIFGTSPTC